MLKSKVTFVLSSLWILINCPDGEASLRSGERCLQYLFSSLSSEKIWIRRYPVKFKIESKSERHVRIKILLRHGTVQSRRIITSTEENGAHLVTLKGGRKHPFEEMSSLTPDSCEPFVNSPKAQQYQPWMSASQGGLPWSECTKGSFCLNDILVLMILRKSKQQKGNSYKLNR